MSVKTPKGADVLLALFRDALPAIQRSRPLCDLDSKNQAVIEEYVVKNGVAHSLQVIVEELLRHKWLPENPFPFIVQRLRVVEIGSVATLPLSLCCPSPSRSKHRRSLCLSN